MDGRSMRRNQHYHDRVNRVLDYIAEHLDGDLSLTRLSGIACFSPFHFHRIFQGVTGETLNSHVRRVRLERAALLINANIASQAHHGCRPGSRFRGNR
jgi:AraC-like DNA-binding protein